MNYSRCLCLRPHPAAPPRTRQDQVEILAEAYADGNGNYRLTRLPFDTSLTVYMESPAESDYVPINFPITVTQEDPQVQQRISTITVNVNSANCFARPQCITLTDNLVGQAQVVEPTLYALV